ncbi:MAG: molybdenum cofactor guanylyltransferase [Spirochaetaceae bacterium]|jgi:molybdopterin-guanine dinucleotide biosynthesis protein A|nr:molybdenum cofactor guanylyltransferase [Spirochaetaceae bacterium]
MNGKGGAVIVAGGMGTRLGYDKKQIMLKGKTLIEHQIEILSPLFSEVIVSSNNPFEYKDIITVRDTLGAGPLAGIYSALKICKSDYLFACACDMPYIQSEYISFLNTYINDKTFDVCAVRRSGGFIEPFNALYHKRALPALEQSLAAGIYKAQRAFTAMQILSLPEEEIERFNTDGRNIFYNINYETDLELIRE